MSDEIKTNDMENEVVETEVPETEEMTDVDHAEDVTEDVAEQENFEEPAELNDSEEAEEPKKKAKKNAAYKINPKTGKKQLRGWLIGLIAFVCVIVIAVSSVLIWVASKGDAMRPSAGKVPAPEGYDISYYTFNDDFYAKYDNYTEHLAQYEELISKCLTVYDPETGEVVQEPTATDEEMVLAAWIIYRVASKADFNAPEKAKYTIGGGFAGGKLTLPKMFPDGPLEVGGGMDMSSTYFTLLDENGNKYVAQEEYTQFPEGSITASDESLVFFGEAGIPILLAFARRGIVTPEKSVTWNGDNVSAEITETGVKGDFVDKKGNFMVLTAEEQAEAASKYERVYGDDWGDEYGGTAPDLSIHVINTDTIIADSVEITEVVATDAEGNEIKIYDVKFSVDVRKVIDAGEDGIAGVHDDNDPTGGVNGKDDKTATQYAEQLYLANAGLGFLEGLGSYDLSYGKLDVTMSVFENGYIRSWSTDETWIMSADITHKDVVNICGKSKCTLTSENYSEEFYTYNHDIVMQGFVNRWIGDNKNVDIPMSSLPFAEELAKYEKQAYGSYR